MFYRSYQDDHLICPAIQLNAPSIAIFCVDKVYVVEEWKEEDLVSQQTSTDSPVKTLHE